MPDPNDRLYDGSDSYTQQSPPPAAYVSWLLAQGDTKTPSSPLHRLGTGPYDAAQGNHKHDGRTSAFLFDPSTDIITGDLATTAGLRTAVKGILNALKKLGIVDNTTN